MLRHNKWKMDELSLTKPHAQKSIDLPEQKSLIFLHENPSIFSHKNPLIFSPENCFIFWCKKQASKAFKCFCLWHNKWKMDKLSLKKPYAQKSIDLPVQKSLIFLCKNPLIFSQKYSFIFSHKNCFIFSCKKQASKAFKPSRTQKPSY